MLFSEGQVNQTSYKYTQGDCSSGKKLYKKIKVCNKLVLLS
jgi:hypothetical protein